MRHFKKIHCLALLLFVVTLAGLSLAAALFFYADKLTIVDQLMLYVVIILILAVLIVISMKLMDELQEQNIRQQEMDKSINKIDKHQQCNCDEKNITKINVEQTASIAQDTKQAPAAFSSNVSPLLPTQVPAPELKTVTWAEVSSMQENEIFGEIKNEQNNFAGNLKEGKLNSPPKIFNGKEDSWGKTLSIETNKRSIWFIGDVHGDLFSLELLSAFAHRHDKEHVKDFTSEERTQLFFIGDFIDDGECSADVMAWLFEKAGPDNKDFDIRAVIGNHDYALSFDEEKKKFVSSVEPCEFCEQLNRHLGNLNVVEFGKAAVEFFKRLPRMVVINKTLMAFHGGVPHVDIQPKLKTQEGLDGTDALRDFVWVRLHERAPEKYPNRETSGTEMGFKDFAKFIEIYKNLHGFAPQIAIRGHDHVEGNYQCLENYKTCRVCTINAFTYRKRFGFGPPCRPPVILRWDPAEPNNSLTVFKFDIPKAIVEEGRNLKSFLEQ